MGRNVGGSITLEEVEVTLLAEAVSVEFDPSEDDVLCKVEVKTPLDTEDFNWDERKLNRAVALLLN